MFTGLCISLISWGFVCEKASRFKFARIKAAGRANPRVGAMVLASGATVILARAFLRIAWTGLRTGSSDHGPGEFD